MISNLSEQDFTRKSCAPAPDAFRQLAHFMNQFKIRFRTEILCRAIFGEKRE